MKEYKLAAVSRDKQPADGKKYIPAEVYGPGIENQHILVEQVSFGKMLATASKSSLIDLLVDQAEPVKVIIKEVQRDPLKDTVIHVDFHQVKMDKKITAQIDINYVGKSPAITNLGGILLTNLNKLTIECLPADLISSVDVDLSAIENLGEAIRVEDLKLADTIMIKDDPRSVILSISSPRKSKADRAADAEDEAAAEAIAEANENEAAAEGEAKAE